ncbi:MAG TPA: PIN domain-containing protein [Rhizomicrobium sp.]|jgi:predicted nucleic acid-binding protein|nr:PIN domain-containing protein [Rhizomicrobium sp.]
MAVNVIVDTGFLIALLNRRDTHHAWAVAQANEHPPQWITCEAALSEAFHLLGATGFNGLAALIQRDVLIAAFRFAESAAPVLALMQKYRQVPMNFADACIVRMTEIMTDPMVLTTDSDFRVYRRHSRQAIPCVIAA